MLLPHFNLDLGPSDSRSKRNAIELDLIARFPGKSILLLAQGDDDQVEMDFSSSSGIVSSLQQNELRRKGDSGVQITDGTVLTWRGELDTSEPIFPSSS